MYHIHSLNGAHLPEKTLCLTYDDGPGSHTLEIARFLYEEQVRATFFVVGKYAIHHTDLLTALRQMKHIVGNHTYEHPDLPYYVSVNGDVVNQILRTDAVISNYTEGITYFRAPYGKWSPEVAQELNTSFLASHNHVGPVHWDIGGIDCYHWQHRKPLEEALENYLQTIRSVNRGIIVMHDEIADMDEVKARQQTAALTRKLIPILKQEGYRFVGLDEVFPVQPAAAPVNLYIAGKHCLRLRETTCFFFADGSLHEPASELSMESIGSGQVRIRATNGCYLSADPETHQVTATRKEADASCCFHLVPVFDNRMILRTETGNFLVAEKNRQLTATAHFMLGATIFTCFPLDSQADKDQSRSVQRKLIVRRLAFIRSKVVDKLRRMFFNQ